MHRAPTGRRMPTQREIRTPRAPRSGARSPSLVRAIAALLLPLSAGCVDILGDYHTSGCSQPDCAKWALRFGDSAGQLASSVAVADNDDIFLLSNAAGAIDFGDGRLQSDGLTDVFVSRLDPGGTPLWTTHFAGGYDDHGNALALDPNGNVLVVGSFQGTVDFGGKKLTSQGDKDIFVAKLSPEGALLWVDRYGDTLGQAAIGVASDGKGNVLVTGCFAGDITVGGDLIQSPGLDDAFVMKLGPDGTPRWAFSTGDPTTFECGYRVAADASNNVLFAGDFNGPVTFDLTHLSAGKSDIFLAELDPMGVPVWSRRYGGAEDDIVGGLLVTPSGRIVLAGAFQGTVDFGGNLPLTSKNGFDPFVLSIQGNGSTVWSRGLGGDEKEVLIGASLDHAGDVLVAGSSGPDALNIDAYAAKIGQKGEVLWSHIWEATGSQEATAIASDSADHTVLVGRFTETLQISGATLESAGDDDVFVAKLGPDTTPPE